MCAGEIALRADRLRDRRQRRRPGRGRSRAPTQKTPFLNSPTSSAAASIESRVFPEPPGPVSVTSRASRSERDDLGDLSLAADEARRGAGEVRVRDRLQRREGLLAELVDPDRLVEVLDAVLAEVADGVAVEQVAGRLREHDLAAVAGRRDPRAEVDVVADVASSVRGRRRRCAGPSARAPARRRAPSWPARAAAAPRRASGEREEERVALRVDLDAAVRRERVAQRRAGARRARRAYRSPELVAAAASSPRCR